MEMTNEEILRDYKAAADKKKQVQILADLNQVKPEEIVEILKAGGVDHRSLPRAKKLPKEEPTEAPAVTEENAEVEPVVVERPRVTPRRIHDLKRMCELFSAMGEEVLLGRIPPEEWVDEFDDLYSCYEWGGSASNG